MLVAGFASVALAASGAVATQTSGALAAAGDVQLIPNGSFTGGSTAGWTIYGVTSQSTASDKLCVNAPAGTANTYDAGIVAKNLTLVAGGTYTLTYTATATPDTAPHVVLQSAAAGYYGYTSSDAVLTAAAQTITKTFTVPATKGATDAELAFQLGKQAIAYQFCLDDVSLTGPPPASAGNQVVNGTFETDSNGWDKNGLTGATTAGGVFCATVPAGTVQPWDASLGQNTLKLTAGQNYVLEFDASASQSFKIRTLTGMAGAPYTTYNAFAPALTPTMTHFRYVFTAPATDPAAQLAFQLGGSATAWTFCLDNVSLMATTEVPKYVPNTGPRVRVNQYGYLPKGPKNATVVTDATTPVEWQLKNSAGTVVLSGMTTPTGIDPTAGLNVHTIDFSSFKMSGAGFTLTADGETSHPFDIAKNIYGKLAVDAASYFYPVRSGIAIDGTIVGDPRYTRPAGHVSTPTTPAAGSVNKGDKEVPCQPLANQTASGENVGNWTCPDGYHLDVVGGWYDAGDHGKYVVNAGISVAQLMQTYERNRDAGDDERGAMADGTLRIAERGNGIPDILDEARWELEWMMSMQVPAGTTMTADGVSFDASGMAHHKVHDESWTGLPLLPHQDPKMRYLHRPSTAATLNLAAAAAQGARLFARFDPAFSAKLLASAKRAYVAAKANPAIFASPNGNGGGPYDDTHVADEFFWAASELYITTRSRPYKTDAVNSPVYGEAIIANGVNNSAIGFDWGNTAPLAWVDLAFLARDRATRKLAEQRIVTAADQIVAIQQAQPFGQMYAPDNHKFDWGSNSLMLNNMEIVGTAYDLTENKVYRSAVLEAMDYLLGRNALNQSYITGYGEQFSHNQHSRWFANEKNDAFPNPPVGSIAGGPNSSIQDPFAGPLLKGCAAQFCYVDDIESWSTNEITINWNSALTWVASFAADQDKG